jgi:signal transduction histidine kinase
VSLRRFLGTSTFRLALLYAALFSLSVAALSGVFYWTTSVALEQERRETVFAEAEALVEQYRLLGPRGLSAAIRERIRPERVGDGIYLLADRDYTPISGNLAGWPVLQSEADGWYEFDVERRGPGEDETVLGARAIHVALAGGLHLLVGQDLAAEEHLQAAILRAGLWVMAVTIALGLGVGFLMSRRLLGRIESINRATARIRAGEVRHRMPVENSGDEFDRLAQNLNSMLDEIERLMGGIRAVTDNIAHDLRSPLTRLKNELELALAGADRDPRTAIERAIAEADGLIKTFNALLAIADAEAGSGRADRAPVELARLVADVAELYAPLSEERGLKLTAAVETPATIEGDRQLLFQALANLVENAIKYAAEGGAIALTLEGPAASPSLVVADRGPGIPEAAREAAMERFVRLDPSRSTPGSGLGLPLVKAIADMHGAAFMLEDNRPGLVARMTFAPPPV